MGFGWKNQGISMLKSSGPSLAELSKDSAAETTQPDFHFSGYEMVVCLRKVKVGEALRAVEVGPSVPGTVVLGLG